MVSEVQTRAMTVSLVGGAAASAVPYDGPTTSVTIANLSIGQPIEYRIGSDAWQHLDGSGGITLPIDLSVDKVRLRRAALEGGEIKVQVTAERDLSLPRAQGRMQVGASVMFLGSSTFAAGSALPNLPKDVGVQSVTPDLTALNARGQFVQRTFVAQGANPVAGGVLRYRAADGSLSWQAPGDAEGPRMPITPEHMWYTLPSATAGMDLFIESIPRLAPAVDVTVNFPAPVSNLWRYDNVSSFGLGGWVQLLSGAPYARTVSYAKSSATLADMRAAHADWEDVYTDTTHIYMGTNDVSSRDTALRALEDMEFIVRSRMAIGSRVVTGTILPVTGRAVAALQAVAEFNFGLRAMGERLGFYVWDAWPYVAAPNGDWLPGYSSDGTHMVPSICYLVNKRAIQPIQKLMPRAQLPSIPLMAAYDAVNAPYGNLLQNPLLTGSANSASAGVTGTVPTDWVAERETGATITAVSTTPDAAGAVPLPDGRVGKYWTIAIANNNAGAAANEAIRIRRSNATPITSVAAGEYVVFEGEIRLKGSGIRSVTVTFIEVAAKITTTYVIQGNGGAEGLEGLDGDTVTLPFRMSPFKVSPGVTNLQTYISVAMKVGGTATLDVVPTLNLHKVPAP